MFIKTKKIQLSFFIGVQHF